MTLTKLELEITGDIDLRGFLDIDPSITRLHYTVRLAGNGIREQFEKTHEVVQRTSPNYCNTLPRPTAAQRLKSISHQRSSRSSVFVGW